MYLIQGMEEKAQLRVNGIQDNTLWLHDFRGRSSVTRTQVCSLKVPTTASWSNGSCNGPAAPFKTMWNGYRSFGKMEVSDDKWESVSNSDDKKLKFCCERSYVTCYKQERKRNSTALQLLEENTDVATENNVSESKEQNAAQRLISKYKSIPIGCIENTEHERKNFSRRNVEKMLFQLMMMMDDLNTFRQKQIQNRIMERLENELFLTYLAHGQSMLMMKCVAEQYLGN